jgi:hypothetical protein
MSGSQGAVDRHSGFSYSGALRGNDLFRKGKR